jgi:hypothetical protein
MNKTDIRNLKIYFVPERKHNASLIQILFLNVVYSDNYWKPTNIVCGQTAGLLNFKTRGTYRYHSSLIG